MRIVNFKFVILLSIKLATLTNLVAQTKEQLYVVVPQMWSESDIQNAFGEKAFVIDTTIKTISPKITRIGLAGSEYKHIPFSPKQYPNLKQLLIAVDQNIPLNVSQFPKLKSLVIGELSVNKSKKNYHIGENDDGSFYNNNDTMLRKLCNIQEIVLPVYVYETYITERSIHKSIRNLDIRLRILPLSLLKKDNKIRISEEFNYVPYPEIAALAQSSYPGIFDTLKWYGESMGIDEDGPIPFQIPNSSSPSKMREKTISGNRHFELYYPNGRLIVKGMVKHGEPDGEWKFWYADGTLCEKRDYNQGIEVGTWVIFNTQSDTIYSMKFDYGDLSFLQTIAPFYSTSLSSLGEERRQYFYADKTIIYSLKLIRDFDSTMQETIITSFQNEYHKKCEFKYYNTYLLSQHCSSYPKPDSKFLTRAEYYRNSTSIKNKEYRYMLNAQAIDSVWYEKGNLERVSVFGYDTILTKQWDTTGHLLSICEVIKKDDIKNCQEFYQNSSVKQKSAFKDNKLHGEQILYDETGRIIYRKIYYFGILKSEEKY
jgi:antitoxin component YwqK of YwqJK toxin-antitoxin module